MLVNIWILLLCLEITDAGYFYGQSKKTWDNAVSVCESLGMQLACIKNENEYTLATNYILSQDNNPVHDIWIGIRIRTKLLSFSFECVDGTEVFFFKWNDTEPNFPKYQECIRLFPHLEYGNQICLNTYYFLCEDIPIHGAWSEWQAWSSCSTSCGLSTRDRMRSCDSPEPQYGGNQCQGEDREVEECVVPNCPGDDQWSAWSDWTTCAVTCGYWLRNRTRACDSHPPTNGGTWCVGENQEQKDCGLAECPGQWSTWKEWSHCHMTECGIGIRTRYRSCDAVDGSCWGVNQEEITCTEVWCPTKERLCVGRVISYNQTMSGSEVEGKIQNIVSALQINKSELSATIRKKTCAEDSRSSSLYMGYLSITLVGVPLA